MTDDTEGEAVVVLEDALSAADARQWQARMERQLGRARWRITTFDVSPRRHRVEVRPARPPMAPAVLLETAQACARWLAFAVALQAQEPAVGKRHPRQGV